MEAAVDESEPDFSGQTLDRYRLLQRIGVGGMGSVYEAEHSALEKRVAIKLLRQDLTVQEMAKKRFLREARAASRIRHPNVVDISDFGEAQGGQVFFVMELLEGRDLQELLTHTPRLPWSRTRNILCQVASALAAAHSKGIVHRDLKPSNCFLVDLPQLTGADDFVKVLDFGIAKLSGRAGERAECLTSTDEVFGTAEYMAPEMVLGSTDDPRSDVYALGVMMYRMLVGRLPFSGGTSFQILSQHVSKPPPSPRIIVPELHPAIEEIVLKAMTKEPDRRFASMLELERAMRSIPDGAGATEVASSHVVPGYSRSDTLSPAIPPLRAVETLASTEISTPSTNRGASAIAAESAQVSPAKEITPVGGRSLVLYALVAISLMLLVGVSVAFGTLLSERNDDTSSVTDHEAGLAQEETRIQEPSPSVEKPDGASPSPSLPRLEEELDELDSIQASTEIAARPDLGGGQEGNQVVPRKTQSARQLSDESVSKKIVRSLRSKCSSDESHQITVRGWISPDGRVNGKIISGATPATETCIETVIDRAKFAPRRGGDRPLPRITIDL